MLCVLFRIHLPLLKTHFPFSPAMPAINNCNNIIMEDTEVDISECLVHVCMTIMT